MIWIALALAGANDDALASGMGKFHELWQGASTEATFPGATILWRRDEPWFRKSQVAGSPLPEPTGLVYNFRIGEEGIGAGFALQEGVLRTLPIRQLPMARKHDLADPPDWAKTAHAAGVEHGKRIVSECYKPDVDVKLFTESFGKRADVVRGELKADLATWKETCDRLKGQEVTLTGLAFAGVVKQAGIIRADVMLQIEAREGEWRVVPFVGRRP